MSRTLASYIGSLPVGTVDAELLGIEGATAKRLDLDTFATQAELDALVITGGSIPEATSAEVLAGTVTAKYVSPAKRATTEARRDVRSYGVVGNGATDDTTNLQTAFNSGLPIIIPANLECIVTAQIVIPAGLDLVLDGRIERTWNGGGSGSAGAMFKAGTDDTTRISNVKIDGLGSVGAQSLAVGSGQIFNLWCDDLRISGITVDTYWSGQAFMITGHRCRMDQVQVKNSAAVSGTGGIRFRGGDDFCAVGCHIECGDDALQFVPNETSAGIPLRRGAYIGCTGYSTAGRFLAVISGGTSTAEIRDVGFYDCHGKASLRGIYILGWESTTSTISGVTVADCSIDMTNDATTLATTEGAVYIRRDNTTATGVVEDVTLRNVHIINPARQAVRVADAATRVKLVDCTFNADRTLASAFVRVETCDQFVMSGCRLLGGSTASTVSIGTLAGTPTRALIEDNTVLDISNATYGINCGAGSGHRVRRNRLVHAAAATPTAGLRFQGAVTDCEAIDNDLAGLTATNLLSAANGTQFKMAGNVGAALSTQTGTAYTQSAVVGQNLVTMSSGSAKTVTLSQDSSPSIPLGEYVDYYNSGAGTLTFAAGASATVNVDPNITLPVAQFSRIRVYKVAANTWLVARG